MQYPILEWNPTGGKRGKYPVEDIIESVGGKQWQVKSFVSMLN